MGLSDYWKALQEFHEKGKLTDQEFVAAKTATLKKHGREPTASVRPGFTWSRLALVLGLLFLVWVLIATELWQ